MTTHAKALTERVTVTARGVPTLAMAAKDLRLLFEGLGRLGYDVDALLVSAGFGDISFDDPDARIPCEVYGAVFTGAQHARHTPNLALELARLTPLGAYPLLDYLVITSDSVGGGVRQLARYFHLIGNPVSISVHEESDFVRVELGGASQAFGVEYLASLLVLHLRSETEHHFSAESVSFRHVPDDVAMFERILACRVYSGAAANVVCVSADAWQLPLRRRDPILRQMLEGHANEILARLPARTGLALEVQRALMPHVAGGDTRIGTTARLLAMSGRTLQRRLAAEGVSYQELLDDTRKEAAGRYLRDPTLAIGEVAYLVGYSEPAAFHRAFKRWYGLTPENFRRSRGPNNDRDL